MAARPPRGRRAGPADEEGRQRAHPRRSAAARSTRSTSASAASTARRARASCAPLVEPLERARELALETVRWAAALAVPRLRARPRVRRAARPGRDYPIERGRLVSDRRPRHRARRVRGALRRGARRALDRAALAAARARRLPRRAAGALRAQLGAAVAARARGGRRGRARRRLPQPVPEHRRARASRSLYALDEALRLIDAYEEPDAPGRRGASRAPATGYGWTEAPRGHALPPLRARRRRHDPRGARSSRRPRRTSATIEDDLRGFVAGNARPRRRRAAASLRAGDPQPRPVHLVRDALPRRSRSSAAERARHRRRQRAGAATTRAGLAVARAPARDAARASRASRTRASRSACSTRWEGADAVIVVDAVRSGAPPGTIHRLDAAGRAAPGGAAARLDPRLRPRRGDRARARARPAARRGSTSTASRASASAPATELSPAVARAVEARRARAARAAREVRSRRGGEAPDGDAPAQT